MSSSFSLFRLVLWFVAAGFAASSCSPNKSVEASAPDPALRAACDELKRLQSITVTGLTYIQYADRLLTAKGIIDVELDHTTDKAAAEKISLAVFYYAQARDEWKKKIDGATLETSVQEQWEEGSRAVEFAIAYCRAPRTQRPEIEELHRKHEERIAEERRVAIEKLEQERLKLEQERLAAAEQKRKDATQAHVLVATFSAADGSRDSAHARRLSLTDVAIEVPSADGSRAIWFGDIVSGERQIGNFYKITPTDGEPILLRFDRIEELEALENNVAAAIDKWRSKYADVIPNLSEPNQQQLASERRQQREEDTRQRREDAAWDAERKKFESQTVFGKPIIVAPAPRQESLTMGRTW